MFIGILIFIGLVIVWVVYSRFSVNKEIAIELNMVENDNPIITNIPVKEFVRYSKSHELRCNVVRGIAIVSYENKVITIVEKDRQTVLYIQVI